MNEYIFRVLNNFAATYTTLDPFIVFLADNLGYLLLGAFIYFLFTHEDKKRGAREVATIILIALAAWIVASIMKHLFYTPRPFLALPDVTLLLPHEADGAFPSGHATFYSALAMAMYFYHKKIAVVFAVSAVIIGIARIMVGVHFPVDILAGLILGPIIAYATYFLINKTFKFTDLPRV